MDTGPGQWTRHGSRTSGRGKWKVDLGRHHQAVRVRLPRHIAQSALDINIHDSGAVLGVIDVAVEAVSPGLDTNIA